MNVVSLSACNIGLNCGIIKVVQLRGDDKYMEEKRLPTDLTTTQLIDKVTNDKYKRFLELYPDTRMITKTAAAIGVTKQTVHNWLNKDSDFLDCFDHLKKELDRELLERHLENIREIVFDKETPPQTRLLGSFFEVKKLNPEYRDRQDPGIQIKGDIQVILNIPEPKYETPPDYIEGEAKELKEGDNAIQGQGSTEESSQ